MCFAVSIASTNSASRPATHLEEGVLGDHPLSRRLRNAGSVAASMAVQASATAPSRTAASADSVMQAAANSRWWLTAPLVSMPMSGWMVGTASDTLAMSVEKVGRGVPASSASNVRPSVSGVGAVGARAAAGIGLHVRVHGRQLVVGDLAACGERPRLEAGLHPGPQGGETLDGGRADHVAGGDGGRDDVGGGRARNDHAVHLVPRRQLLAQQADRHLGDRQGVLRVHALPGRGGRVRLPPGVVDVEMGHGEARARQPLSRPGVHHHRGVHAGEGAALEHQDLAAAALLRRRARAPGR